MVYSNPEDGLKLYAYHLVDRENPGLAKKNPREYVRLSKGLYEKIKSEAGTKLRGLSKKNPIKNGSVIPKVKKSRTLAEFVTEGLSTYARDYQELDREEKKERNKSAWDYIKKFCKERMSPKEKIRFVTSFYEVYKNLRKSNSTPSPSSP